MKIGQCVTVRTNENPKDCFTTTVTYYEWWFLKKCEGTIYLATKQKSLEFAMDFLQNLHECKK